MNRIIVIIGLLVAFFSMLSDNYISYNYLKKSQNLADKRTLILHGITDLEAYLNHMIEIETGQRGYILTGNKDYLESYQQGLESLQDNPFLNSTNVTLDEKNDENQIEELKNLTALKLKEAKQTLDAFDKEGFEAAKTIINSNSGKNIMDQIRNLIQKILNEKRESLRETTQKVIDNFRHLFYITILSNLLSFGLIATCLIVLNYDIKKRQKTEEDLQKLHYLQNVIVDSAKEAIITVDPEGVILTFNPGSEKLFKKSAKECIGKNLGELLNYSDNQSTLSRLSRNYKIPFYNLMDYITFAAKRNIKEDIPLVTSENNEKRYVVFSASPLLNKDGRQNEGFLLEGFDVTERKAWEEELKIAHLKAEAGNMAKSQFLANISHDIRTPLTAILGFTEILKNKNLPLSPKELGFLDRIEENGKTLISLIDLILDLEKIEVGKLKVEKSDVNLADLIKKITDQLEVQFLAKPDLKLILELPSPLEPVYTDPQKLTQILMNLIANSIKFTTKGYLKIKVIADESTQVAKKIEISDSGNGMEKEELTKIFDAFYQVRGSKISKKLGIGLGLAIVKSLCDLLDYDISVKSEPGKGTTFTILLS